MCFKFIIRFLRIASHTTRPCWCRQNARGRLNRLEWLHQAHTPRILSRKGTSRTRPKGMILIRAFQYFRIVSSHETCFVKLITHVCIPPSRRKIFYRYQNGLCHLEIRSARGIVMITPTESGRVITMASCRTTVVFAEPEARDIQFCLSGL